MASVVQLQILHLIPTSLKSCCFYAVAIRYRKEKFDKNTDVEATPKEISYANDSLKSVMVDSNGTRLFIKVISMLTEDDFQLTQLLSNVTGVFENILHEVEMIMITDLINRDNLSSEKALK